MAASGRSLMEQHALAADRSKGPVTGVLHRPNNALALYVLAHGAGADMRHRFLEAMADELAAVGIATLRFNFPYTSRLPRADPAPVRPALVCCDARARARSAAFRAGSRSAAGCARTHARAGHRGRAPRSSASRCTSEQEASRARAERCAR
jgi:hypothetical protein